MTEKPLPQCVLDLIAVLNGDGGHYRAEHGLEAACKRAEGRYYAKTAEPLSAIDPDKPWWTGAEVRAAIAHAIAQQPSPVCQYAIDVGMPEHRCAKVCQYAAPKTEEPLPTDFEAWWADWNGVPPNHAFSDDIGKLLALEAWNAALAAPKTADVEAMCERLRYSDRMLEELAAQQNFTLPAENVFVDAAAMLRRLEFVGHKQDIYASDIEAFVQSLEKESHYDTIESMNGSLPVWTDDALDRHAVQAIEQWIEREARKK